MRPPIPMFLVVEKSALIRDAPIDNQDGVGDGSQRLVFRDGALVEVLSGRKGAVIQDAPYGIKMGNLSVCSDWKSWPNPTPKLQEVGSGGLAGPGRY